MRKSWTPEPVDTNTARGYYEYQGLTRDRNIWISPIGLGPEPYFVNDINMQDEMLQKFVSIQGNETKLLEWLREFGPTDTVQPNRDYERAEELRWLLQLHEAATKHDRASEIFLRKYLVENPAQSEQAVLTTHERSHLNELVNLESRSTRGGSRTRPATPGTDLSKPYQLSEEEQKWLGHMRAKCRQFADEHIVVGFERQKHRSFCCTYKRNLWKGELEQIRHAAINSIVIAVSSNLSDLAVFGAALSIKWRQDPKLGEWAPQWDFIVKTPWQAMNYAIYRRVLAGAPMKFCLECGSALMFERSSRKYCESPRTCKDDYNNRRRPTAKKKARRG